MQENTEEIKIDRRTRKTKKAIKTAFMDLIAKSDISKITVKEVSELADINRKTFYVYYSGVDDVSDEIENEIVDNIIKLMNEYNFAKFMTNPYLVLNQITDYINEDTEFYGKFFNSKISGAILEKVKKIIKDKLLPVFKEKADLTLVNYTIEYSLGGLIAAYREWLGSDKKITLEELSKHLSLIAVNGLNPIYVNIN